MKRLCFCVLLSLVIVGFVTPVHAETAKEWLIKGYDFSQLGKYEDALEAYDKAIEIDPQSDRAWDMKGEVYLTLKRYEEAIEAYDKDLQNNGPDNPENYWSLTAKGDCLLSLERYDEAVDAYSQALEIDSTHFNASDIQARLANTLKNLGRYEEAIGILDQLLENDPDDFRRWNDKGDCLSKLGRYEEAIGAYDHSSDLNPESTYAEDMKEEIRNQDVKENIPDEADTPAGQNEDAVIEEPAEEPEYEAAMDAPAKETDAKAQIQDPPVNGCIKYDSGATTSYSCDCSNYATMCQKKYHYEESSGKLVKVFESKFSSEMPEGYFHSCCGDKWIEVPIDQPTEEEPTEAPTEKPVEEKPVEKPVVSEPVKLLAVGDMFNGEGELSWVFSAFEPIGEISIVITEASDTLLYDSLEQTDEQEISLKVELSNSIDGIANSLEGEGVYYPKENSIYFLSPSIEGYNSYRIRLKI